MYDNGSGKEEKDGVWVRVRVKQMSFELDDGGRGGDSKNGDGGWLRQRT